MKETMMIVASFAVMSIFTSCNVKDGIDGADDQVCMIEELEDGVYISCPDSDVFLPRDPAGPEVEEVIVIECKRGKGHKIHDHKGHEPCPD